ncbi:MAG TPA: hypothetical protein VGR07_09455, partial [Thermoanaerobaculia bacterium]|nr:hypothetical protein [Thermoanaerobaculia bacterium]
MAWPKGGTGKAKGKPKGKPGDFRQPEGKVRRSQVVTTFGPGAMIDLVDQAVMVGGLDVWSYPPGRRREASVPEPRLRETLLERLAGGDLKLAAEHYFLQPPPGNDKEPQRESGIRVLEYPQWFVCQNPECRALVRFDGLEAKGQSYVHDCGRGRAKSKCVPVRFVAACERGHVEDLPWRDFAHRNRPPGSICPAPSLRLREGATGDFFEIVVECLACGGQARLSSAAAPGALGTCHGHRPWLGDAAAACDRPLRLLVRSASNAYFAQVVSAVSIPEKGKELEDAVRSQWNVLQTATAGTLPAFRTIPGVQVALAPYGDAEVLAVIDDIRN